MPSPTKRNIEKELVQSCNISWKAAKDLTDAVRGSARNGDEDAVLEAAMNRYQRNPEAYVTVKRRTAQRNTRRDSSESSGTDVTASMRINDADDEILDEIEV